MKVIKIEMPEMGGCIIPVGGECNDPVDVVTDELRTMIEDGSPGDSFTVTLLEMSQKEINELPEWTGW